MKFPIHKIEIALKIKIMINKHFLLNTLKLNNQLSVNKYAPILFFVCLFIRKLKIFLLTLIKFKYRLIYSFLTSFCFLNLIFRNRSNSVKFDDKRMI